MNTVFCNNAYVVPSMTCELNKSSLITGKVINIWADKGMVLEGSEDNSHWSTGGKTKLHRASLPFFATLYGKWRTE